MLTKHTVHNTVPSSSEFRVLKERGERIGNYFQKNKKIIQKSNQNLGSAVRCQTQFELKASSKQFKNDRLRNKHGKVV